MNKTYLLYGVLAGAVLIWLVRGWGTSEEAKIQAQLDEVASLISKDSDESALESADRARQLGELFTEEMVVHLRPLGMEIRTGAELVRPFVGLRSGMSQITLSFDVEELEVAESFPTAAMITRASVSGQGEARNGRESFRIKIAWKKVRGTWLMESFDVVERLEGNLFGV